MTILKTEIVEELKSRFRGKVLLPQDHGYEGEAGVRDAYTGETWDRLVQIKNKYDPGNLFRLNQNIQPA